MYGSERHAYASGDGAQRLALISSHPNLELCLVADGGWSAVAVSVFSCCLDAGPDARTSKLPAKLSELADVIEEFRVSGVLARREAVEHLRYDSSLNEVQERLETVDCARAQISRVGYDKHILVTEDRQGIQEPRSVRDDASTRRRLLEDARADRLERLPLRPRVPRI